LHGDERLGEHARGDGVVPRGPGPNLVLIDADEIFSLFVVLLSVPPVMYLNRVILSHRR